MPACAQANGDAAHDRSRAVAGSTPLHAGAARGHRDRQDARLPAASVHVHLTGRFRPLRIRIVPVWQAAHPTSGAHAHQHSSPSRPHARGSLGSCAFRGRLQRMPRGKCYHALSWGLGSSWHCSVERGICHYDVLVVENDCVCRTARFQLYCLKSRDGAIE